MNRRLLLSWRCFSKLRFYPIRSDGEDDVWITKGVEQGSCPRTNAEIEAVRGAVADNRFMTETSLALSPW